MAAAPLTAPVAGGLRRAIVAASVLLLGGVAASRLTLGGRASSQRPAVRLAVALPEATDTGDVAQRFAVPLESVARALPGARSITGEVTASGVSLRVTLEAGRDPELAAARASAALGELRRRVPERGSVSAVPLASESDLGVIVALSGADAETRGREVVDALRALPGVRDVAVDGLPSRELRVVLRRGDDDLAQQVTTALRGVTASPKLGEGAWADGDRVAAVVATSQGAGDPGRAIVSLGGAPLPVAALGTIIEGRRPPETVAHVDGRRAVLLDVLASAGASLAAVDRDVRHLLAERTEAASGRLRATIVSSDADALRRLLARLAIGLAVASIVAGIAGLARFGGAGAWRLGLAVPLGLAAALNGLWLLGASLDETTAPLVSLAVVLALPLAFARLEGGPSRATGGVTWIACVVGAGAIVPVALHLAGGRLAPAWAQPAQAFALSLALACTATLAWEAMPARRPRSRRTWRILRATLADPAIALLAAATVTYVGFTLFGRALDPRALTAPRAEGAALVVQLSFPIGTPLSRTEQALGAVEGWLGERSEVEMTWGRAASDGAFCVARLRPGRRATAAIARMRLLLEPVARRTGAVTRIDVERSGAASALLTRGDEELPETDEAATRYRAIVSAPSVDGLRTSVDRLLGVAGGAGVKSQLQVVEWSAPTTRVELAPRRGTTDEDMRSVSASLAWASEGPQRWSWPAREPTDLVVAWPGAPEPDDVAPQRMDLLARPRRVGGRIAVVNAMARIVDSVVPPRLQREAGRFVVPVGLGFDSRSEDARKGTRERVDTGLSVLKLPDGCEIARPSLQGLAWKPERLRLLALALAAPLALFLAGSVVLDSLARAVVALVPLAVGLVLGAATLTLTGSAFDGGAFTLLAAAVCGALPFGLGILVPARGATFATAKWAAVRPARRALPVAVTLAAALVAVAAATWGLDRVEDAWVAPLVAACLTAAGAAVASVVVAPASTLALAALERRRGASGQALRHPPAWRAADAPLAHAPLHVAVRHVTKIYSSGFRALHDVSFELEPGIVGLLGPNGAGKTTLLRIMTGLLQPTRGEVSFRGVAIGPDNIAEFRRHLGFLPQEFNAYPGFSARQFLEYWANERGMKLAGARDAEIDERLADVGLSADADRKVRDFSGGMRQRLGIARALLGSPPLLIVDEPTTGLDVEARTRFRDALLTVAAQRLVVLSTHVASDVEATASRLLLLHRGRIQFDGTPASLIDRARGRVIETVVDDAELQAFSRRHRVTARVRVLSGIRVRAVLAPGEPAPGSVVRPSLEEAYLAEIDVAERR